MRYGHGFGMDLGSTGRSGLRGRASVVILVAVRRHDLNIVLPAEHADNLPLPSLLSGFGASSRAVVSPDWAAAPEARGDSALRTRHNTQA
jgi:hypothetical protein